MFRAVSFADDYLLFLLTLMSLDDIILNVNCNGSFMLSDTIFHIETRWNRGKTHAFACSFSRRIGTSYLADRRMTIHLPLNSLEYAALGQT